MSAPDPPATRHRLLEAAVELALRGGPQALTARALTTAVGASPSAVNYHFGGRLGLLCAAHAQIAAQAEAWRTHRLAASPAAAGAPAWPVIAGCLVDLAFSGRAERLALLEFAALAAETDADLLAAAREDHSRQASFWRTALATLGRPAEEAEIWAAMAFAATPLVLLDEDPAAAVAWIAPAALRLEERLSGRASAGAIAWLASSERPPSEPLHPPGAQRLIEATLRVIAAQGLQAATLRAIADEAQMSLGSTTYFFDSKADIIRAAFVQLRNEASAAALRAGMRSGRALTGAELGAGGPAPEALRGMAAVTLAGARHADLQPVALSLRSLTGQTSSRWLAARCAGACDRLDGFLASLLSQGLRGEAEWRCRPDDASTIEARLAAMMDRLFPPASAGGVVT